MTARLEGGCETRESMSDRQGDYESMRVLANNVLEI